MRSLFSIQKLVFLSVLLLASCSGTHESRLKEYQTCKCDLVLLKKQIDGEKKKALKSRYLEQLNLKKKLQAAREKYDRRLLALNEDKKAANNTFIKQYRKLTDAHSRIHGHRSTPDYELKVDLLSEKKYRSLQKIEFQIMEIEFQLEKDLAISQLSKELDNTSNKIKAITQKVDLTYAAQKDELQNRLNKLETEFERITSTLEKNEKLAFKGKKDSINKIPCGK